MKRIEKIWVRKGSDVFIYTGELTDLENGWVEIKTTRGETLRFRKEQVEERKEAKRGDINERKSTQSS